MDKYYYDFHYFFSRKDSGSFYICFDTELDVNDQDSCIEIAIKVGAIFSEYANNIDYVEELTIEEARDIINIEEATVYSI